MLGIFYLLIMVLVGWKISDRFLKNSVRNGGWNGNRIWLYIPASIGVGILLMGWMTYLISWTASAWGNLEEPLIIGNLVSVIVAIALIVWLICRDLPKVSKEQDTDGTRKCSLEMFRKNGLILSRNLISDKKLFIRESIFFILMMMFLNWIFFYVFHIIDGRLYSGFTVFGDYAPHTAMMRSFSWENNYPTQYPHFGGEDIKYHFMFQFLVGNLEYLGMRLDVAYNVLSLLVLEGFLMLLYILAQRIVKSSAAGIITIFLFMFRSSFSFWIYVWESWNAGNLWEALTTNTVFIGYTANENWGLWNFNVYLNQRHLGLGMLVVSLAIWIYFDWLEESTGHGEKGILWVKNRLFTKNAWMWKQPLTAVFVGVLLGSCSFWNGAAVIGGLLILFGFAACSDGKLDYALTAVITIALSLIQTNVFIEESNMELSFYWGFLAEDKSLWGVIKYLLIMSGIFFVAIIIPAIAATWRERAVLVAFLLPTVFAFTISLTPDINVNHKYMMISYAFLAMFWAALLVKIWKQHWRLKFDAVVLAILLTITGVYDFVVILLDNDVYHRVSVNMESTLTEWLSDNLDHDDLLLTPQYSMNEVTMSGVMLYSGWPYYAWSAGYDTNYRAQCAVEIYTSEDAEYVKNLIEEENITYVLYEEGMEYEQQSCKEDTIAQVCTLVFTSEDGRIRVYEV